MKSKKQKVFSVLSAIFCLFVILSPFVVQVIIDKKDSDEFLDYFYIWGMMVCSAILGIIAIINKECIATIVGIVACIAGTVYMLIIEDKTGIASNIDWIFSGYLFLLLSVLALIFGRKIGGQKISRVVQIEIVVLLVVNVVVNIYLSTGESYVFWLSGEYENIYFRIMMITNSLADVFWGIWILTCNKCSEKISSLHMQKIIKKVLVIIGIFAGLIMFGAIGNTVWRYSTSEATEAKDFEYHVMDDDTIEINKVKHTWVKAVEIPDEIKGMPVTKIGENAFRECKKLSSIDIPKGVTSIGDYAFFDCYSLDSIKLPASLTSIGDSAFKVCVSLRSIKIPHGVTSIGDSAFFYCDALTRVEIPEGVTSIGQKAFYGCDALTRVEIPEGVTSIGQEAFYGCDALTHVEIPEGVTSIGDQAFESCCSLKSIKLPANLTSIGQSAFERCSALDHVEIPEGVTSIGQRAFESCSALTHVEIPEGVTSIGDYAFSSCFKLKSIKLPASLTSIGKYVIGGSYAEVYVIIGTYAEEWAMNNCSRYNVQYYSPGE